VIVPWAWTSEQLETARLEAIGLFRRERAEEPLEDYLAAFDQYRKHMEGLLNRTADLAELDASAIEVLTDARLLEVFRYLAGPPISQDDLKVLAEAPSLAKSRLTSNPGEARRLIDVVRLVLDRRRFAWVVENRAATESERSAAVTASAALMAASRVQTNRRSLGKKQQEGLVAMALQELGLTEVAPRNILNFAQAPAPGEFCGESSFGGRKADIIVRLWDHRVMPIECKVSNSALNSVKRLNNDAAVKAVGWKRDFGLLQVVPVAVLGGVYKLAHLLDAQDRGLSLVWSHDLASLTSWIRKTGP
jgi:hypothetical protein